MITQEKFDLIESEHGCGYWNLCWEHACPCAITTENKGLQERIYNSFIEENKEISKQFDEEFNNCDYYDDNDTDDDYEDYEGEYDE